MNRLRATLALIFAGTLGISALSLLLPRPSDVDIKLYYSPIATSVTLIDVLLAVGAAILFLIALRNFRPELKPAYRLMAYSALAVGVFLLVFPYIEYYGLWDNVYLNMSSYLQYLIGAPLMYLGVRMFYKRVGKGGWLASLPIIVGLMAVLSLVHTLLPHVDVWPMFSEIQHDLFEIVTVIPIVAYAAAMIMAIYAWQRTGQEYRKAFGWLAAGLALYVVETLGVTILEIIGYENWYFDTRAYTVPAILGDLCLVFAGYSFSAIGRTQKYRVGWLRKLFHGQTEETVSSVDIVLYITQLASDQSKIDAYLDGMREVTATTKPDQPFSPEAQKRLRDVYLQIENYLIGDDPLRRYQKEDLRARISTRFDLGTRGNTTFWPMLT